MRTLNGLIVVLAAMAVIIAIAMLIVAYGDIKIGIELFEDGSFVVRLAGCVPGMLCY